MKYAYGILAALLVVGAYGFPLSFNNDDYELNDLDRDIIEFFQLLPPNEILKIVEDHASDPEFWAVLDYAMSDEFHKLLYTVEDLPEFQEYVLFIQKAGYNVFRELKSVHESLGMKEFLPPKDGSSEMMANLKKGGGFNGYLDDMLAILPKKEIQELHEKKLKESPAFAKFVAAVSSPKFAVLTLALFSQKPTSTLVNEADAHGIDFYRIYDFRLRLIGLD